jgi:carbon monoxide dehydrogenase subunit G
MAIGGTEWVTKHPGVEGSMLHFEGDKTFSQTADDLWAKLSDARFLVQCIPGVESVSQVEPQQAVCVIRPGFAFVRGTLEITLRVTDAEPGKAIRFQARSRGIGSSSTVEAGLTLLLQEGKTQVHWTADVTELGGLLKAVPRGLIQASAQKVIADVWAAVEQRLTV